MQSRGIEKKSYERKKSYKKQYLNSVYDIEKGNLANAIFAFKLHYFQHNIKESRSIDYGKWYKRFDNLILKLVDSR